MAGRKIMTAYPAFLESKRLVFRSHGRTVAADEISPVLFPFQRDLTRWAVRKGRSAIFADTGLGKTLMQLEWCRLVDAERRLIIAPLTVAQQTIREARDKLGLEIAYSRDGTFPTETTITNYEHAHKFDATAIGAIVLDESSILKSIDGKYKERMTRQFRDVAHKLCCTATPAPNDIAEIANHAEFLGIMSRQEMLAGFFVHDCNSKTQVGWRLKGHAEEPFYRWLASWGMSVKKPSDIGHDDDGFILPELTVTPHFVQTDYKPPGELFFTQLKGIQDRVRVRRATLDDRVAHAVSLVDAEPDEQWIVWCGLNDEGRALERSMSDAVLVEGSQSLEEKQARILSFLDGSSRVMIVKPKIAGFGMNFQHCARMVFVGLSDSWEAYYQCVRRCWRFGQTRAVEAHIVLSEPEKAIWTNVKRKEREAERMSKELIKNVAQYEKEEIDDGDEGREEYTTAEASGKNWRLLLGDSCERLGELEEASIGLSVYSPPFGSLYVYSPTERDVGNSATDDEFFKHYGFVIDELRRVTKPGRNTCCHVQQLPTTKAYDGVIGIKDFRGRVVSEYVDRGWIYHGEVMVDKDPQAQAIRTKAKALLFVTKQKDSSWLRPALADYILVFRKPGDNEEPIKCDVSNEEWILWARPVWYGIRESDTLKYERARDERDEKHICPLQLETIERCVRLWSNRGDTVLSPFAGIGSEGVVSVRQHRKFIGVELKESYFRAARKNLSDAERNVESQLEFFPDGEST